MGISGLLPLLKSIHKHIELKQFAGETLGVDGYGWLHRGAISCAVELAEGTPSRRYVDFAMHRVRMMKHFGVTPYVVFDGDFLPSKSGTEASRTKRREDSRKAGLELLRAGKASQAHLELQKAIDISPEMARHLIEELKKASVPYIVAPYEADAQLVYLERLGLVAGIITEDSDLLVFGAKRLLTKMDQYGRCVEINRRDFCAVREISLTGWTDAEFRHMAILSGCDYLKGLENMGLKTAYRMIRKYKTPERVIKMIQFDGKHRVPENYMADFKQADLTFLHQRVFCPKKQDLAFLTEPDPSLDILSMPFLGASIGTELARGIAAGDINPITKRLIDVPASFGKRRGTQQAVGTVNTAPRASAKPIETYFRGHRRIPLAEMEPNCFALKPNHLNGNPNSESSPLVFPLPRPYLDDSTSETESSQPHTARHSSRRRTEPIPRIPNILESTTSSWARRRTAGVGDLNLASQQSVGSASRVPGSLTRPSKKPRLCEDQSQESEDGQTSQRSKFFPGGHGKETKPDNSGSFLISHDSPEEALLSLPDLDGWRSERPPKTGGKVEIFADSPDRVRIDRPAEASSKDNDIILHSDVEIPTSSLDPAMQPEAEKSAKGPWPGSSQANFRRSLRQFASNSTSSSPHPIPTNQALVVHGIPTPATSAQKQAATGGQKPMRTPRLTPLQRIGVRALQNCTPAESPSPTSPIAFHKTVPGRSVLSFTNFPVNAAFVPLPKVDVEEIHALSACCGSEDQIVPDSDTE